MRKQEKAIIWPAYFDLNKTRKQGRRVPKNLAVQSPKIEEIEEATKTLNLNHEITLEKGYPRTPWFKAGMLLVQKQGSKEQVIKKIAKQLFKNRNDASRMK
jgi:signal recognition particle subunit SRP19